MTKLHALYGDFGQSPWIDNLERSWLGDGTLSSLVDQGVRGLTSNPSIMAKAIKNGEGYQEQIEKLSSLSAQSLYWELVLTDIEGAADQLLDLYYASGGRDGFVSVEVDPKFALDPAATIKSAVEIYERIAMPNVMIKIPATKKCLPAITEVIGKGISVNATLIFGLERYREVCQAHLAGIQKLAERYPSKLKSTHSVASFFVSRTDTLVDALLDSKGGPKHLKGGAALASAKLAYDFYCGFTVAEEWMKLKNIGGVPQRPLWASTSTKNPQYPDLLYVDNLIGPDTVNTMPPATLEAFLDHGELRPGLTDGVEDARSLLREIGEFGINLDQVFKQLESEGLEAFAASHEQILSTLEQWIA